ncbi:TPA: hypothetical protein HIT51_004130 [Escherichia coli]|uniref:hypothetical protein n=1 Tax=Escherichia coli TaxID=562 RepID=UPI000B7E6F9B|nr:hypothetical protein [Escherichia coli]EEY8282361.1 hypothetical protein [Escherichia coli]EGN7972615.1 hypothetical protein [Escherichia coli]HAH2544627.1 hypothetical protein [Escherichia coli]HAI1330706.1 hypothetical protein [Escherichia coli]HAI1377417.1 hypothetical protein [Escherichia coli]
MSESSSDENDEELAPMVDGLSGALCIFILITTVFMISGIDTVVTGTGRAFTSEASKIDINNQVIYFNDVISLSGEQYKIIREKLHSQGGKNLTLDAYTSYGTEGGAVRLKKELIYSLLKFKDDINEHDLKITLKISDEKKCTNGVFCIAWSID